MAASRVGGPKNARALAYHLGRAEAMDWLLLDGADVAPLEGWKIPTFPLKGGAIVARGVSAGPEVARILLMIEAHWVAEGFPDAERVQALLDKALGK
jgi:poly(A) polymerase